MGPLLALKGRFCENVRRLILCRDVSKKKPWIILQSFQQPVQGDPLSPIAMLEDWGSAFYDCGNDGVIVLENKKCCSLGNWKTYWIEMVVAPWVILIFRSFRIAFWILGFCLWCQNIKGSIHEIEGR